MRDLIELCACLMLTGIVLCVVAIGVTSGVWTALIVALGMAVCGVIMREG